MDIMNNFIKTKMKLHIILINLFLLTAYAQNVSKDDPLPEVLHHLKPYYNFSTYDNKTMEAIMFTTKYWRENPILNETNTLDGTWVATHDINWEALADYLEVYRLEYVYLCGFYFHALPGLPQFISCFNWTKEDAAFLYEKYDVAIWYKTKQPDVDYFISYGVIITTTGVFGNILILFVLLKYKHMKNPTNLLLGSLAVNDLLVTGLYPAIMIYSKYFKHFLPSGDLGCNFIEFSEKLLFVNSVFHLTAVSFERFFAICMAMKVKTICTMKRAKILAPSLWVAAVIVALPSMFIKEAAMNSHCIYRPEYWYTYWFKTHKAYELGLLVGIPLILIIHNYSRIIITLIKSLRQNAALMEGASSQGTSRADNEDVRKRMKVVKMLVAIVIFFIICWMPRVIFDIMFGLDARGFQIRLSIKTVSDLQAALTCWSYVNSVVNAPIYFFTSNQFNKAFKRALTCGRLGKDERVTSMITQSSMASTSMTEKGSSVNPSKA